MSTYRIQEVSTFYPRLCLGGTFRGNTAGVRAGFDYTGAGPHFQHPVNSQWF